MSRSVASPRGATTISSAGRGSSGSRPVLVPSSHDRADFLQPHFLAATTACGWYSRAAGRKTPIRTTARGRPRVEWEALPGSRRTRSTESSTTRCPKVDDKRIGNDSMASSTVPLGLAFGVDWHAVDDLLDPSRAGRRTPRSNRSAASSAATSRSPFHRGGTPLSAAPPGDRARARARAGSATHRGEHEHPALRAVLCRGINSVRGYDRLGSGRRPLRAREGERRRSRVHPRQPIGGRSIVEGSVELQYPISEKIAAAVFLRRGADSTASYDSRWTTSGTVSVRAPLQESRRPLRLDLGFPRAAEGRFALADHVSIGQAF